MFTRTLGDQENFVLVFLPWVLLWGAFPTLLPSHSPGTERQDCPPSCHQMGFGLQRGSFRGFRDTYKHKFPEGLLDLPLNLVTLLSSFLRTPRVGLPVSLAFTTSRWGSGGVRGREMVGKVGWQGFSPCLACKV